MAAMPPHLARLFVDAAYVEDPTIGSTPDPVEESGYFRSVDLTGKNIVIPGGTPISPNAPFTPRVVTLSQVSDTPTLPDGHFDETQPLPDEMAARFTFTGGQARCAPASDLWNIMPSNGKPEIKETPLDVGAEWEVDGISGNSITLAGINWPDGTPIMLRPIQDQIRLHVYCLPRPDLPGSPLPDPSTLPKPGDQAAHFHLFYTVFQPYGSVKPSMSVTPAVVTLAKLAVRVSLTRRCVLAQL
jgi:hypothetical protein